jgi:hypothetical protein
VLLIAMQSFNTSGMLSGNNGFQISMLDADVPEDRTRDRLC